MPICNIPANNAMNQMFSGTKYVALFTADPTQAGVMTNEMAGDGYVRKAITFTSSSGRSVATADVLWWADLPNTPIRYIAVCTALSGGTMVAYKATGSDIYVAEGKRFTIAAGDLAFTLN